MSDVSVGDARADIGFEFIVEFEIVNGGQAERRNGVECAVFLMFRLSGCMLRWPLLPEEVLSFLPNSFMFTEYLLSFHFL
ncbi:Uncharacterised protein [Neisseria gonorrhoeae]|nr:Uncharacterised protein [Neisseria gonorrhoeae]